MRLDQMIEGNDTVLRHVASEREKNALVVVSPMARQAIKKEILPQLEESINDAADIDDLTEQTKEAIEAGFQAKNPVYTRLISYKSIDQSDSQYLADLLTVMDEWARKTKESLEKKDEKDEKGQNKPEEIKVKVEVESDINVKTDSPDGVEVSVTKPDASEEAEEAAEGEAPEMPYADIPDQKGQTAEREEDVSTGSPAMLLFDLKDLRL